MHRGLAGKAAEINGEGNHINSTKEDRSTAPSVKDRRTGEPLDATGSLTDTDIDQEDERVT
jgi:hypothetical protein